MEFTLHREIYGTCRGKVLAIHGNLRYIEKFTVHVEEKFSPYLETLLRLL
jgi:hypothetical protein